MGRPGGIGASDLARELAGLPEVTKRLLELHVADRHGKCRACTTPGTGIPRAPWPCVLHFYATAADEIRRRWAPRG